MGMHVGNAIIAGCEHAIKHKLPLVLFSAAGGARMQEGILSLMQMPRTTVAVDMLREAGYRGAVSMFSQAASVTADRFCLRRIMPHRGDSALSFRMKLSPLYLRYVAWRDSRKR
jgi:hypothetical protein